MVTGIIGKKVGMTQLFLEDGTLEPATVLQAGPCIVVQSKSAQTDGYEAEQLGLVEKNPPRRATKASTGHHKKANVPPTGVQRVLKVAMGAVAP
jgi:large subunit ribosomal protein L3